jgi:hypothetical protein
MVELMIVIGIIAMLVALLLGAVTRVLQIQARTETLHEIKKMDQSLQVAMGKYNNLPIVPSRLILLNDTSIYRLDPTSQQKTLQSAPYNFTNQEVQAARQTAIVFRYMFGKRFISNGGTTMGWAPGGQQGFAKLKGAECLVFYLGGVLDSSGKLSGFSTDPVNPLNPVGDRIGPFFEFRTNRLRSLGNTGYFGYMDPYGKGVTYAFFGTTAPNGYSTFGGDDCYDAVNNVGLDGASNPNGLYSGAYCDQGGPPTKYYNPNLFQIVSAGRDGQFGPGGLLPPGGSGPVGPTADNLANFSQTELGNPVE